ncbi:hypothetical protein ACKWTF_004649 [Chironomus riparius]
MTIRLVSKTKQGTVMKIFYLFCVICVMAACTESSGDFDILFESSYKMLTSKRELFKQSNIEEQQNGLAYAYDGFMDQLTILIAKGTNRITGIDSNYTTEVLNGENSPPISLTCVKDGLTELQEEMHESRKLSKSMKQSFKAPELTLNTCDDATNAVVPHLNMILTAFSPFVANYKQYVGTFDSLNMLDLFTNFWISKGKFDMEAIAIVTANVLNADQQDAVDYVKEFNKTLSFPLSCAADALDMCVSQMKIVYECVLKNC